MRYVPSPIVAGKYLLVVADSGVATCFDAKSGDVHWTKRLAGKQSPSPVLAGGIVYFFSDRGEATLVRPGEEFEVVARNSLKESISSSPAISQGQIFVRTHEAFYCIGRK